MRFNVRMAIGNRLGAGSTYTLVEICVHLVDRYSLKEAELTKIVQLQPGEVFKNKDLEVTRLEKDRFEIAAEQVKGSGT